MKVRNWVIGIVMGLWSLNVMATPFQSNYCPKLAAQIRMPTNASAVYFDEKCETAYVSPPKNGRVRIAGAVTNLNIQFCPSLITILDTIRSDSQTIANLSGKISKLTESYSPYSKEIQSLGEKDIETTSKVELLKKNLTVEDEVLHELRSALSDTRGALQNCLDIARQDTSQCVSQKTNVDQALNSVIAQNNILYRKKNELADAEFSQTKIRRSLQYKTEEYEQAVLSVTKIRDVVEKLQESSLRSYERYGRLPAATVQTIFDIQWVELIQEFQKLNPRLKIAFAMLPTTSTTLHATLRRGADDKLGDIPAIIQAYIPGLRVDSNSTAGSMETIVGGAASGSFSGQLILSTLGACPIYLQGEHGTTNRDAMNKLTSLLAVNAYLNFPLAVKRKYSASYNLSNLMTKLEQKTQKGGFLSATDAISLIDSNQTTDWFSIKFSEDDSKHSYSPEEKNQIVHEAKLDLIERTVKNNATFGAQTSSPPPLPELPDTAAGKLGKTKCFAWAMCYVGSFILGTIDTVFGEKSATSNFKKQHQSWAEDRVDDAKVLQRTIQITFENNSSGTVTR